MRVRLLAEGDEEVQRRVSVCVSVCVCACLQKATRRCSGGALWSRKGSFCTCPRSNDIAIERYYY